MPRPRIFSILGVSLMLAVTAWPVTSESFRNVEVGSPVPNINLPTLRGKKAPLLRRDRKANVFFFFRPDQEHSIELLAQIAQCKKELAGKSIYWVGVVSDYYPLADSRKVVRDAGLNVPILLDKGDVLYGKIGVKLHPSVGVADGKLRLVAYQPFRRINYCEIIKARILHTLGEIDDAALAKVLDPPKATQGGNAAKARRDFKFSQMLYKAKKLDKALKMARHAVELDPAGADNQAMLALILADQGKCTEAATHAGYALGIDAAHARALEVQKTCGGEPTPLPTDKKKATTEAGEGKPGADNDAVEKKAEDGVRGGKHRAPAKPEKKGSRGKKLKNVH